MYANAQVPEAFNKKHELYSELLSNLAGVEDRLPSGGFILVGCTARHAESNCPSSCPNKAAEIVPLQPLKVQTNDTQHCNRPTCNVFVAEQRLFEVMCAASAATKD